MTFDPDDGSYNFLPHYDDPNRGMRLLLIFLLVSLVGARTWRYSDLYMQQLCQALYILTFHH